MSTKEIPQTDSIEELAQFWDSHDLTDFAEELEEVSEPVFERETAVTIHLSCEEAKR
ncbi:MAG: CopG family antitoxin [Acidobacteriota bacterium]